MQKSKEYRQIKKNDLSVRPITRRSALPFIIDRHYMHRVPPISEAFGLFNSDKMIGIVTYGI